MPRWMAVVAVLAVAAVVCAFTVHHALAPAALVAQLSQEAIPADGFSSSELTIRSPSGRALRGLKVEIETPHAAVLESLAVADTSATASLRAGVVPGEVKLRITAPGFVPHEVMLRTTADNGDSVGDGTPDFLRLHDPADRLAFRRWFTLLAEAQFYQGKPQAEIDDCAALLRFSYREALRAHDASWSRAMALPVPVSSEDVRQYQYPYTPLGTELFRVRDGSFTEQDVRDGAFAQFADAETLWRHNTFLIGRDVARARPGDLLFFRQDTAERMPFHAMIYLGNSQIDPGSEKFVVYHTGPNGKSPGQMKRLSITELLNYPDARWQPVPSNPVFLGVYRWNILRGGE
ncbi:MAG TPA: DUF1175 family protein [Terriglobales bacterium]|nr:DUF1175 family protein [Terriglobales bacterium]